MSSKLTTWILMIMRYIQIGYDIDIHIPATLKLKIAQGVCTMLSIEFVKISPYGNCIRQIYSGRLG